MTAWSTSYNTPDDTCECDDWVYTDCVKKEVALEGALIEVGSISLLDVFSSGMTYESHRDYQQDEGAANASSISDEKLRVLIEYRCDDHWNWNQNTPDTLNNLFRIL